MKELSIVVPSCNEEAILQETAKTLSNLMQTNSIPHQIIFVDDGSRDATWFQIKHACQRYDHMVGVQLSKNFGKEGAILAGLKEATGDAVAIIDCDLQHPPHVLVEMYRIWESGGVDIVEGVKESRGRESLVYKLFSKLFYATLVKYGGIDIERSSDFQLLDRRVVDIIVELPEKQRFFRALTNWVGFSKAQVAFKVEPRIAGVSKFNFGVSLKYAVANITSFSSYPMQFITLMGAGLLVVSAGLGVQTLYNWLMGRAAEGFTTLILIVLFTSSLLMIAVGIIGVYIAKIYEEIKDRPNYLVRDRIESIEEAIS